MRFFMRPSVPRAAVRLTGVLAASCAQRTSRPREKWIADLERCLTAAVFAAQERAARF
jgi:hypothetical protein